MHPMYHPPLNIDPSGTYTYKILYPFSGCTHQERAQELVSTYDAEGIPKYNAILRKTRQAVWSPISFETTNIRVLAAMIGRKVVTEQICGASSPSWTKSKHMATRQELHENIGRGKQAQKLTWRKKKTCVCIPGSLLFRLASLRKTIVSTYRNTRYFLLAATFPACTLNVLHLFYTLRNSFMYCAGQIPDVVLCYLCGSGLGRWQAPMSVWVWRCSRLDNNGMPTTVFISFVGGNLSFEGGVTSYGISL